MEIESGQSSTKRKGRSAAFFIGGLALFLVLAFAYARLTMPPERLLPPISKPELPSYETRGNGLILRHSWKSVHETLEITKPRPMASKGVRAALLDTRTGIRRYLPGLSSGLQGISTDMYDPSPDGRWVMCWGYMRSGTDWPLYDYVAASMDGKRRIRIPAAPHDPTALLSVGWLSDGHTYAVVYRDQVQLYDLLKPARASVKPMPSLPPHATAQPCEMPDHRRLFLLSDGTRTSDVAEVGLLDVLRTPPTLERRSIRLPMRCKAVGVSADRRSGRLAWHLEVEAAEETSRVLSYLRRLSGSNPHARYGLWVSDPQGKEFREVGHVHDMTFAGAWWLPDGKRIGYWHRGQTYSVAAP